MDTSERLVRELGMYANNALQIARETVLGFGKGSALKMAGLGVLASIVPMEYAQAGEVQSIDTYDSIMDQAREAKKSGNLSGAEKYAELAVIEASTDEEREEALRYQFWCEAGQVKTEEALETGARYLETNPDSEAIKAAVDRLRKQSDENSELEITYDDINIISSTAEEREVAMKSYRNFMQKNPDAIPFDELDDMIFDTESGQSYTVVFPPSGGTTKMKRILTETEDGMIILERNDDGFAGYMLEIIRKNNDGQSQVLNRIRGHQESYHQIRGDTEKNGGIYWTIYGETWYVNVTSEDFEGIVSGNVELHPRFKILSGMDVNPEHSVDDVEISVNNTSGRYMALGLDGAEFDLAKLESPTIILDMQKTAERYNSFHNPSGDYLAMMDTIEYWFTLGEKLGLGDGNIRGKKTGSELDINLYDFPMDEKRCATVSFQISVHGKDADESHRGGGVYKGTFTITDSIIEQQIAENPSE